MTINNGLAAFKKSLATQPRFSPQAPRLCFLNTVKPDIEDDLLSDKYQAGYPDDIVIKTPTKMPIPEVESYLYSRYSDFRLVNVFKHLKRLKTNLIDVALYTQPQYNHLLLVTDNHILDYCQTHYQVALLDATEDYFLNHYLDCATNDEPHNLKYTTQCLVFIASDGSYFLALPCSCTETDMLTAPLVQQQVIKTTVKQIEQILDPVPLLRMGQISWLKLHYIETKIEKAKDLPNTVMSYIYMGYCDSVADTNHHYTVSDSRIKRIDRIFMDIYMGYCDSVADTNHYYTVSDSRIKRIGRIFMDNPMQAESECDLYLSESAELNLIDLGIDYFNRHLCPIIKDGLVRCTLTKSNKHYEQIFAEIKIHNLNLLADEDTYKDYEIHKYQALAICYQHTIADNMQRIFDLTGKKDIIMAKEVPVKSMPPVKPLITSAGLNKVMLSLVENADKPYYLVNKNLVTLGGHQEIEWIKQKKLPE